MRIWIAALWFATGLMAADATYDGSRVHYESYGKGPEAVVFIHGWTCDLTFWRGQAPLYEKRRALLIDLPGHGQSEAPKVEYTMERFARAIDAVMRDAGVSKRVIVGHSMGGPVALTFLRLFPAKTSGLVLVDAFIPAPPKNAEEEAKSRARVPLLTATCKKRNKKNTIKKMKNGLSWAKPTPAMRRNTTARRTPA